jgi:hypothetical protein
MLNRAGQSLSDLGNIACRFLAEKENNCGSILFVAGLKDTAAELHGGILFVYWKTHSKDVSLTQVTLNFFLVRPN